MIGRPLALVLFDCDGTLVDSGFAIQDCMEKAFEAFSYEPPSFEQTKSIIGLSLDTAIAHLLHRQIDDEVGQMVVAYKAAFSTLRQDIAFEEPLYDGIKKALAAFERQDDILLGMVTGKSRRGADLVCKTHGLDCFITTKTADDCPSKPDPTMVLSCCDETGVDATNTYVVGDSIYDMQMAKLAGATAIGVSWGYHTAQALQQAGADMIAKKPEDLPILIEAHIHARNS